jgi:hypothetical protein
MTTSLRSPPSERDLEIYQQITMRGLSTRLVADDHEISQTRVRQIVRRVLDWVAATLPEQPETDARRELRLAQHIAADRLQESYCELMSQWRHKHEPRIFGQLLRVTLAASRVSALPGTIDGLIADAIEGPLPDCGADVSPASEWNRTLEQAPEAEIASTRTGNVDQEYGRPDAYPTPPPLRDCSPEPAAGPPTNRNVELAVAATAVANSDYNANQPPAARPAKPSNSTAKPLLTSPSRHSVTQVRVASDAPAEVTLEAIRHRREHQKRGFARSAAR